MYAMCISSLNLEKASSFLKKGGVYTKDSVGTIKTVRDDITITQLKQMDAKRIEHVKIFSDHTCSFPVPARRVAPFDSDETVTLFERMRRDYSSKSIAKIVFESEYYLSFVRLSMNTKSRSHFGHIATSDSLGSSKLSAIETFMWEVMIKCVEYSQDISTSKTPANVLCFNEKLMAFR